MDHGSDYGSTLALRLATADMVIVLDLPRTICAWRITRRVLLGSVGGWVRRDHAPGCRERFDGEFVELIRYVWRYPRDRRPLRQQMIERQPHGLRAVRAFLRQLSAATGPGR